MCVCLFVLCINSMNKDNDDEIERRKLVELMEENFTKKEIINILYKTVTDLDTKQKKNNANNRSLNSIMFVGMISISDVISDLVVIMIYLLSDDLYLKQLGHISGGILLFSFFFGGIMAWLLKAPFWEILLSLIGFGPIAGIHISFFIPFIFN